MDCVMLSIECHSLRPDILVYAAQKSVYILRTFYDTFDMSRWNHMSRLHSNVQDF